jgi:ABC-2 type transport system ATP-binding protein
VTPILDVVGLGKRYGRTWALRECSLSVPPGAVVALVGPNGAGKTTLLSLAVGLLRPTAGSVRVLGADPFSDAETRSSIGFVPQDTPLYRDFTAEDLLTLGCKLNRRWNGALARDRLTGLDVPLDRPTGRLSGGQRAQVALAMVLAKEPSLLVLDEPVASLDPLARREFLQTLAGGVADWGLTVVLSSHLLEDLERLCDHLIVLSHSRTQVQGLVDDLLTDHRFLVGPRSGADAIERATDVIQATHSERQSILLVRGRPPDVPGWVEHDVSLQELVLAYLARPSATALPGPTRVLEHREASG